MLRVNVNGKIIVLILSMILFVSACGSDDDIDYLGNSYSPTSRVDVYFSEDDITEGYLVMGRATVDGGDAEALQEKLIEKAREMRVWEYLKVTQTLPTPAWQSNNPVRSTRRHEQPLQPYHRCSRKRSVLLQVRPRARQ